MAAAVPRRERAAAAAILAAATVLAGWITLHRPPQMPVRIVEQEADPPEKSAPEPVRDAPATPAMKFEIVDLPPPAPAAVSSAQAPAPAQPVQLARTEPAPENPPEPPRQHPAQTTEMAPAPPPRTLTPLQPEPRPRAAIVPLRVEIPVEGPVSPVRPPLLLRPGDEKASAAPAPLPPLHAESAAAVPREARAMPAPKIEAWTPTQKPRAPATEPAPVIHVEAPPAPPKAVAEKEVATEGRVLLRMFEQGAGPSVEIRWPSQAFDRDRLYDVFTRCLGMKVGLLDDQGHVYLGEGPRQQAMAINLDKYSGFVRRPEGAIASDEQREIARIRAYHGMSAPPARMFPRRVDAYLLGGLRAAVGDRYLKMKSVRAAYRLSGARVMIESIVADGRSVDGVIDLSTVASCN